MMNFYYDSVLGLVYNFFDPMLIIDIAIAPKKLDIDEWCYYMKGQGIQLIDSVNHHSQSIETVPQVWSNYQQCINGYDWNKINSEFEKTFIPGTTKRVYNTLEELSLDLNK